MLGENVESKDTQKGKSFSSLAFSNAKNRLRQMANNKAIAKQSAVDESMNHLTAGAEDLDRQAYKTNNEALSKEYQKQSQLAKVAYMVKYAATKSGADWSDLNNVSDIMNTYLRNISGNPEKGKAIAQFINSDDDAEEFGIRMGWIESDYDDTMNKMEQFLDGIYNIIKAPADIFGQGINDLVGWAERATGAEGAANIRALNDFAYNKYGKYIDDMTEDEILRLELDLQLQNAANGSWIDDGFGGTANVAGDGTSAYQDNVDRQRLDVGLEETALGGGLTAAELAWSVPTLGFSILANTPGTEWLLNKWMELGYNIGDLTTLLPEFGDYVEGLPEDLQENYKNIAGNALLALLTHYTGKYTTTKNVGGKRVWREPIQNIINNINQKDFMRTVEKLYARHKMINPDLSMDMLKNPYDTLKGWASNSMEAVKGDINDIGSVFKGIKKSKPTGEGERIPSLKDLTREEENMKLATDIAGKVAGSTNGEFAIGETDITRRALQELKDSGIDLSKITTDEQLLESLGEHSDQIAVFEDGIYSQDKRRWKKTNTVGVVKNTDAFGISDAYISDQIGKGFDVLKDIYKNSPQILSELRILEQRWEKVGLTRQEVNNMARMISEGAKIYKTTNRDMLTAEWVDKAEKARNGLKEWARLPYKDTVPGLYQALEYLDNAWSDNLNLQAMTVRNLGDAQAYRNGTPWQERWQELGTVGQRTWNSKGKNVVDAILKNKRYTPSTRAADLQKNLTKFQKIDSKLPRENYQQKVKEWYEETFRDIVSPEGTSYNLGEGEVINPNKNRYSDPRNYLEDIVEVVTETEMGESDILRLESQLRKLGLSEEEITAAKEATKIVQDSLFKEGDVDNAVTVAEVKDGVATKPLKSRNSKKK